MATVTAKDFTTEKITVTEPQQVKINGKAIGSKNAWVNYAGNRLVMQTAREMVLPFGVGCYDKVDPPKFSIDFSFRNMDNNPEIKAFYDALASLDEFMIALGVKNCQAWFGKKLGEDVIRSMLYKSSLKEAKDKDGKSYPPSLKINLKRKTDKDGNDLGFGLDVVDAKRKSVPTGDIQKGWGKGSTVTALLECGGMWLSTVGYGLSWRIKKLMVHTDVKRNDEFDFVMDGPAGEEEAEQEQEAPKSDFHEDASPPPLSAQQNAKPSAFASVMPAAAAANPFSAIADQLDEEEDEDEETIAPVEVPKKPVVKKKVISKKA
jgi:hypothetical protein